jgi:DNA-binding HxlR family transcriptional regulator
MARARHSATTNYGKGTPTREALERLANRWTVLITNALEDRPIRFNDLKSQLGVSAQVLTRTLRDLERDGLVTRQVFAEVPVRVEYALTTLGGTMCPIVHAVRDWAENSAGAISEARLAFDGRPPVAQRVGTATTPRRAPGRHRAGEDSAG